MKFTEKNNFLVKNKDTQYFDKDLALFKEQCPASRLHVELKRVNSFNKSVLQGRMLYELLDKCTPEEILKNRGVEVKEDILLESIDQAKETVSETETVETATEEENPEEEKGNVEESQELQKEKRGVPTMQNPPPPPKKKEASKKSSQT